MARSGIGGIGGDRGTKHVESVIGFPFGEHTVRFLDSVGNGLHRGSDRRSSSEANRHG